MGWTEAGEVVTRRAEVIVDDIEEHGQTAGMAGINQALQSLFTTADASPLKTISAVSHLEIAIVWGSPGRASCFSVDSLCSIRSGCC